MKHAKRRGGGAAADSVPDDTKAAGRGSAGEAKRDAASRASGPAAKQREVVRGDAEPGGAADRAGTGEMKGEKRRGGGATADSTCDDARAAGRGSAGEAKRDAASRASGAGGQATRGAAGEAKRGAARAAKGAARAAKGGAREAKRGAARKAKRGAGEAKRGAAGEAKRGTAGEAKRGAAGKAKRGAAGEAKRGAREAKRGAASRARATGAGRTRGDSKQRAPAGLRASRARRDLAARDEPDRRKASRRAAGGAASRPSKRTPPAPRTGRRGERLLEGADGTIRTASIRAALLAPAAVVPPDEARTQRLKIPPPPPRTAVERKPEYVKVYLHNRGEDVESAWCVPLGPFGEGALFRLANVPFLHAKPTFGDVIVAHADPSLDGAWAWDRDAVDWTRIRERIHQDGGRYAVIVDYSMDDGADFDALLLRLRRDGIIPEGLFGPRGTEPGRLYLAAPGAVRVPAVMASLQKGGPRFRFRLVHPQ